MKVALMWALIGLSTPVLPVMYASTALAQSTVGQAEGEVRKVDRDTAKVTLRHGPISGLDMPAMTMVFRVKDSSILDQVKVGDRIRFTTTNEGGALTLISVEPLP